MSKWKVRGQHQPHTTSFYGAKPWRLAPAIADPVMLDKMIIWKSQGPDGLLWDTERSKLMNRQFTIELRVDYADAEKNEVMRAALQIAGRHMMATAQLLSDGVKPQIALFSDDFFDGHAEIALIEDTIQQGKDLLALQAAGSTADAGETVSSDLLDACKPEPK